MTITLIILAYVANVFLNRGLNYLLVKYYDERTLVGMWFASLIGTLGAILLLIICYFENNDTWFTGKHWKK